MNRVFCATQLFSHAHNQNIKMISRFNLYIYIYVCIPAFYPRDHKHGSANQSRGRISEILLLFHIRIRFISSYKHASDAVIHAAFHACWCLDGASLLVSIGDEIWNDKWDPLRRGSVARQTAKSCLSEYPNDAIDFCLKDQFYGIAAKMWYLHKFNPVFPFSFFLSDSKTYPQLTADVFVISCSIGP